MAKKDKFKSRLPLIEVFVGSLIVHIVAAVILAGYVIAVQLPKKETEFTPPPEVKSVQPKKLEYKRKLKKQQQKSAKPKRQRIDIKRSTQIKPPNVSIDLPNFSPSVSIGAGAGGVGTGSGLGGGSLGLGQFDFDFLSIKSKGEKIAIMVDSSRTMLSDNMGGWPAYKIVKDEIKELVSNIPNGLLFNIGYFTHEVGFYDPKGLSAKTSNTLSHFSAWQDPINGSNSMIAKLPPSSTYKLKTHEYSPWDASKNGVDYSNVILDFDPIPLKARTWVQGLIAAMEMQADTIFLVTNKFGNISYINYTKQQIRNHKKAQGLSDTYLDAEAAAVAKAAAKLKKDNAKRKASGKPVRVVSAQVVAKEQGFKFQYPAKPLPSPTDKDVLQALRRIRDQLYRRNGLSDPIINVILYMPKSTTAAEEAREEAAFEPFIKLGKKGDLRIIKGEDALKRAGDSDL